MSRPRKQPLRLAVLAGGIATTLAAVAVSATAVTSPTSASGLAPHYGAVVVEQQDPGYQYRAMPALQYVRWTDPNGVAQKRFVRSFQISADDGSLKTRIQYHVGGSLTDTDNWRHALDASTGRPLLESTPYAKVNNVFQATNGDTVAIDEQGRLDANGRFLGRRASNDGGVHWNSARAALDMAGGAIHPCTRGRAFQRVIRLPDQTLVMPFYAAHKATYEPGHDGDCSEITRSWSAAHLLVSDDDGTSWRRAATPFKSDVNTYSESSVARRSDGRLIMISRYDVVQNGDRLAKLAYRVTNAPISTGDDLVSATWGPWTAVKVPGAADPGVVQGVAPVLHEMRDGLLMLVFGRPRNKIAYSTDSGASWSGVHSFYDNIPTSGCGNGYALGDGTYIPCPSLGSSGYMGVAVTSPRTAYVMGDNCHTNWGCAGDYSYPHDRDDRLWITTLTLD